MKRTNVIVSQRYLTAVYRFEETYVLLQTVLYLFSRTLHSSPESNMCCSVPAQTQTWYCARVRRISVHLAAAEAPG